jgi:hypothetical protein
VKLWKALDKKYKVKDASMKKFIVGIVATQFLTHVLINFQKKSKNSEKH